MGHGLRTALLVITAPLWLPFYLLAGLCGLCTDGLLFLAEEYLGSSLPSGPALRVALALPSLVLFPMAATVEFVALGLLSAGRWPLHLALDGLLALTTGIAAGLLAAFTGHGAPVGVAAAVLMQCWLVATNAVPRWFWLLKGGTATAVLGLAGLAGLVQLMPPGELIPAPSLLMMPLGGALVGVAATAVGFLARRPLQRVLFEAWEPGGVAGNALAAARGVLTAALFPAWFPVLCGTWIAERLFGGLMIPDVAHKLSSGGLGGLTHGSRFSSYVGLRYMKGKRDQRFVSVITVLSVLAVAMGVWTLTVVLSVMSGFEADLREKILGTNSHAVVLNYAGTFPDYRDVMEKVEGVDGVVATTPFVYTELMVKHNDNVTGAVLKGIDPATVGAVTSLVRDLDQGPGGELEELPEKQALLDGLDDPWVQPEGRVIKDPDLELPGIVIGQEMATLLRAHVGDVVLVTSPFGEPGPFGTLVTTMQKFRVKAVFYSGMYEYDTKFLYVSIPAAQKFLKFDDEVTGIELVVEDLYQADRVVDDIERELRYPFWGRDWMAMNKNLFAALKLEKAVMAIILSFIYVGAALNIIVVLIMVVMEKQKEIAILRAMGAAKDQVMKAFMIEGLIIGFVGTTAGTVLGLATCLALDRWRFIPLDTDVYYLDTLPVVLDPWTFVWVAAFAIAVSFLATLYPSWNAAEVDPVEGLRYE